MTLIQRTVRERILLVGVVGPGATRAEVEEQLDELAALVDTAGADVVGRVVQARDAPDPATYVGSGKAEELHLLSETLDVDTVVFDDELSPGQQRNLEKILGRTAIDRTAVILDVFAQNAKSKEGKAQVELALLRYRLPRLVGRGKSLSQQVGRIGTRGPGETKLEEDRRRIQDRISQLRRELGALESQRHVQRKARARSRTYQVTIVGYTNVGKSSLLNALCGSDVLVEDRLFATLDPRTRRLKLRGGESVLLTDTVGFIRKLPHQLVESFRSTLETVAEADLLIHVADASSPRMEEQMREVEETLREIGAASIPRLVVYNKIDALPKGEVQTAIPGLLVSVRSGAGLTELVDALGDALRQGSALRTYRIPFAAARVLALVHREAEVIAEFTLEDGVEVTARVDRAGDEVISRALASVSGNSEEPVPDRVE